MASTSERTFEIGPHTVDPGGRRRCQLRVARLPTDTWLSLPIEVVHGASPGEHLWLTAAVHGDEVNGVEIINRVLGSLDEKRMRGTLVAVPIVNIFGFIAQERYLPDRRDLNRSFPGSARGSLAARLAHLLTTQVIMRCGHGIDLHTGSHHRFNLPQVRGDYDDPATAAMARAFGAPVMLHARAKAGTLRHTALKRGNRVLLFEGGEALRFDEHAISRGTAGVLRVMQMLNMIDEAPPPEKTHRASGSKWLRARRAGIVHMEVKAGDIVAPGDVLAAIRDPFGRNVGVVRAKRRGVVIGLTLNPLATQGDALIHVADDDEET